MPKQRTTITTIEAQHAMSLADLKFHIEAALREYFSNEGDFQLKQVRSQVTQAPVTAATKAKK